MSREVRKEKVKMRAGKYMIPVQLTYVGKRIEFQFGFNRTLMDEIKSMRGAKWHGFDEKPRKIWSVADCPRNRFTIDYLTGGNPFAPYDAELQHYDAKRPLYNHQRDMLDFVLTRRQCLMAAEMGTGKTLVIIEAMEHVKALYGLDDFRAWYVGPKSGVMAVKRELRKWESSVKPVMHTYQGFTNTLKKWDDTKIMPKFIVFDESSKLKTPTAQRTQAAMHLADNMRETFGNDCFIIAMSGSPSPKTPIDWWAQLEVVAPGFLREGTIHLLKNRLCLTEQRESQSGGTYPHILTWLDDENKCAQCGKLNDEHLGFEFDGHAFQPSVNEVEKLHRRMQGAVIIKLKNECLDLPEKYYRIIQVVPDQQTVKAMAIIKSRCARAVTALTLLRELSDGFQYTEEVVGERTCPNCNGDKVITAPVLKDGLDPLSAPTYDEDAYVMKEITCDVCGGLGLVPKYKRSQDNVISPKDKVFIDLLDEYEDVGRFVVWGGFTGTIDRLITIAHQYGWATISVDGRGYRAASVEGEVLDAEEVLDAMDRTHPRAKELREKYPRVCFVGHPDAGGTALTLHASPVALYYSNSFNGESRIQSEDRIHRIGMDDNRGATIIDLIHLPTDLLVLENLKKKKRLQNITMNQLRDNFIDAENLNIERYEDG